jgi:WD40 repeat protein
MAIRSWNVSKAKIEHEGCINTAKWNARGDLLFTGSDDRSVKIWSVPGSLDRVTLQHTVRTQHRGNIFCVDFTAVDPNRIVTAAADGTVRTSYLHSTNTGVTVHTSDDIM